MKTRTLKILISAALLTVMLCACGDKTTPNAPDPTALIVGIWNNAEDKVVTEFNADGTCSTVQNGETIYTDTYTVEKVDDSTIIVTTGDGQTMEITFVDENTFTYEGATITRATGEEQDTAPENSEESANTPETLIIGTWTAEGSSIEFREDGTAVTVDENGGTGEFTYKLETSPDSTFTISLIDIDGTSSSETSSFQGSDTLMIGETAFSREN